MSLTDTTVPQPSPSSVPQRTRRRRLLSPEERARRQRWGRQWAQVAKTISRELRAER